MVMLYIQNVILRAKIARKFEKTKSFDENFKMVQLQLNMSIEFIEDASPFAHVLEYHVLDALHILVGDDDGCAVAPIQKENIWNRQKCEKFSFPALYSLKKLVNSCGMNWNKNGMNTAQITRFSSDIPISQENSPNYKAPEGQAIRG